MTPRTWSYGEVEGDDLALRDQPYESFGQQGFAMPDHAPRSYAPQRMRRGAERIADLFWWMTGGGTIVWLAVARTWAALFAPGLNPRKAILDECVALNLPSSSKRNVGRGV